MRQIVRALVLAFPLIAFLAASPALAQDPGPIGSIRGRLVDAQTGQPVGGVGATALVILVRENGAIAAFTQQDAQGVFRFERDLQGNPIASGVFGVAVLLDGFQQFNLFPFSVAAGENKDLGDLRLMRLPVFISEIQPCQGLSADGGRCTYSARINNNLDTRIMGSAFSVVQGSLLGSPLGNTTFEASALGAATSQIVTRAPIAIAAGKSRVVTFTFDVPPASALPVDASLCPSLFVGGDPSPLTNTFRQQRLFCVSRVEGGYTVAP